MPLALLQSMRPKQWTKNLLLFAGVVFSANLTNLEMLGRASLGFLIFCALSGAVYILNDIRDAESDRAHPTKRNRPIASGRLNKKVALIAALLIFHGAMFSGLAISRPFGYCAIAYFTLTVLYTIRLKHVVILDLMLLALGFVLRAVAGVWIIADLGPDVPLTAWFLACTFFLALFLAICKRRHELLLLDTEASAHRPVLDEYSASFLDQMVSVATAATVISYAMYTTSPGAIGAAPADPGDGSSPMVYTLPFVVYGIFRYLYQVYRKEQGGAPETVLLTDPYMIANIALWLTTVIYIMYF